MIFCKMLYGQTSSSKGSFDWVTLYQTSLTKCRLTGHRLPKSHLAFWGLIFVFQRSNETDNAWWESCSWRTWLDKPRNWTGASKPWSCWTGACSSGGSTRKRFRRRRHRTSCICKGCVPEIAKNNSKVKEIFSY